MRVLYLPVILIREEVTKSAPTNQGGGSTKNFAGLWNSPPLPFGVLFARLMKSKGKRERDLGDGISLFSGAYGRFFSVGLACRIVSRTFIPPFFWKIFFILKVFFRRRIDRLFCNGSRNSGRNCFQIRDFESFFFWNLKFFSGESEILIVSLLLTRVLFYE